MSMCQTWKNTKNRLKIKTFTFHKFVFIFSNPVAGESSLDRFTCALGGKAVLPHIIATIPPMLQHGECFFYLFFYLINIQDIAYQSDCH